MRPQIAAFLAIVLVPAAVLASCKKQETPSQATGKGGKGGRGAGGAGMAFAVETLRVEAKKLDYVVEAPGTIEAFERVQVTARVAGVVDRIAFREGQDVKRGDALVVIDSERYRLTTNSATAALEKAQAAQRDVEAMVTRREGASDQHPGLIPGEELATYRTKSVTAKADSAVAAEALKIAELNLRDSSIRAPIDGVIQTRTVETGQYVQPGYVMATLLRNDPLLLRFQVDPQEAVRLKPDMPVSFTLRETERKFAAKITLVAAAADPTTHMVSVVAQVVDEGHRYWLRPGSFCDVTITVGAAREAPVIPRTATRATDRGYVTYVVENDVASQHLVELGMSSKDGWVEIRSGLKPGDVIVIRGAEALSEGAKVRPAGSSAPDASGRRSEGAPGASGAPAGSGGGRRRGRPGAEGAGAGAGAPGGGPGPEPGK